MEEINETAPVPSVHKILAHSYVVYFLFFLAGVTLDLIFNLKIFKGAGVPAFGFLFLITGTILILWAQKATRSLKKEDITKETFCHGPYCYTRNPTHWGLFFVSIGFGLVINAFFVIVFSVVYFIFSKFTFIRKEERVLAMKYGEPYLEYKRSVRF